MNTCKTCKWWGEGAEKCHRYPPVYTKWENDDGWNMISLIPDAMPNDWCGEYEPTSTESPGDRVLGSDDIMQEGDILKTDRGEAEPIDISVGKKASTVTSCRGFYVIRPAKRG